MENYNTVDKTIRVSRPTFYYNRRGAGYFRLLPRAFPRS